MTTSPVQAPSGRYLITGAAGFIGARLASRLAEAGREAVLLDIARPAHVAAGHRFVACDLTDARAVAEALRDVSIDYAAHFAARVGDWGTYGQFEGINVRGTRNVLDALTRGGARAVVHLSSIAAMGLDAGVDADERVAPITVGDPYSLTKAEGERVAREFQRRGAPIIIVRPGDVYGVGSIPWVVRPVELMRKGQMLLIEGGRGHFAHTHVDNLLDAVLLAFATEAARGETFLVADNHGCAIGTYFTRLALAAGTPAPRRSVPRGVARVAAGAMELVARISGRPPPFSRNAVDFMLRRGSFSTAKARSLLHWTPRVSLDEGLAAIGVHYRART